MKNSKLSLFTVLVFAFTTLLFSCNRSNAPVYTNYQKLTNVSWDRFDIKHFDIPFDETAKDCDIAVIVHCTEKFKYDNLPLYVILTSPTGEESIRELSIPIRANGKMVTEPNGTKSESRLVVWQNLHDIKGNYKISIENMTPVIQTAGIDDIGVVVTDSE